MLDTEFTPDWVSPPGHTIADLLEERSLTKEWLASRLDMTLDDVEDLLEGGAAITTWRARQLEQAFGAPAGFWLRRDALYWYDLERLRVKPAE